MEGGDIRTRSNSSNGGAFAFAFARDGVRLVQTVYAFMETGGGLDLIPSIDPRLPLLDVEGS